MRRISLPLFLALALTPANAVAVEGRGAPLMEEPLPARDDGAIADGAVPLQVAPANVPLDAVMVTLATIGAQPQTGGFVPDSDGFWVVMRSNRLDQVEFQAHIPAGMSADTLIVKINSPESGLHAFTFKLPAAGGRTVVCRTRQRFAEEELHGITATLYSGGWRGTEMTSCNGYFRGFDFYGVREYTDADLSAAFGLGGGGTALFGMRKSAGSMSLDSYLNMLCGKLRAQSAKSRIPSADAARPVGRFEDAEKYMEAAQHLYGRAYYGLPLPLALQREWSGDAIADRLETALDLIETGAMAAPCMDAPDGFRLFIGKVLEDIRLLHCIQRSLPQDDPALQRYGMTVLDVSARMPFFVDARDWFVGSCRRLLVAGNDNFLKDGAPLDGDIFGKAAPALAAWTMAEENIGAFPGVDKLLDDFREQYRKPMEHMRKHLAPGGGVPRFGLQGAVRPDPSWVRRVAAAALAMEGEKPFVDGNVFTAGRSWPEASGNDCYGGLYVMRGGPSVDERYLCFTVRPYRTDQAIHQDFGSMSLWAYGVEFIVDPGWGAIDAEWYTKSPYSHSTIFLDGVPFGTGSYPSAGRPMPWDWFSNPVMDLVRVNAGPMTREIAYVRSFDLRTGTDYWIVTDSVDAPPGPHDLFWKFQLAPGLFVVRHGNIANVQAQHTANLQIIPADPTRDALFAMGEANVHGMPLLPSTKQALVKATAGLVASDGGKLVPAPAVFYASKVDESVRFHTVLLPFPTGYRGIHEVKERRSLNGNGGHLVTIDSGTERLDGFLVGSGRGKDVYSTPEVQFEGDRALVRIFEGKIQLVSCVRTERLCYEEGGNSFWDIVFDRPTSFTISKTPYGRVEITLDPSEKLEVDVKHVRLGLDFEKARFKLRPGSPRRF